MAGQYDLEIEFHDQLLRCRSYLLVTWLKVETGKEVKEVPEKIRKAILMTMANNEYFTEQFQFEEDLIFVTDLYGTSIFKDGKKICVSKNPEAYTEYFLLSKDTIVTLDNFGILTIWNRESQKVCHQIDTGETFSDSSRTSIWQLYQLSSTLILTSSAERSILWNMVTGDASLCPELIGGICFGGGKFICISEGQAILRNYSVGYRSKKDPDVEPSPNNLYKKEVSKVLPILIKHLKSGISFV